ncbi:MAG: hypothetical protein L6V93_03585 [Clostridiales bacterium]|nr:MAG: hypothetical protein L6V93_03585 [Clostridiales bacterium]
MVTLISVMNGDFYEKYQKILHTFTAAVMAVSTLAFSAVCTAQGAEQSAQADVFIRGILCGFKY